MWLKWLFASKKTMAAPQVATEVALQSMFHWKTDATEDFNVLALFPTGFGKSLIYQLAPRVVSRFHCWSDWLKLACRQMVRLIMGQVDSASACPFPQSTRVKKSLSNRSSKCWVHWFDSDVTIIQLDSLLVLNCNNSTGLLVSAFQKLFTGFLICRCN